MSALVAAGLPLTTIDRHGTELPVAPMVGEGIMYPNQYGETPSEDRTAPQHTTPTLRPPTPRKMPWLTLTAITAGFLGLAIGVASLALFLSWKGSGPRLVGEDSLHPEFTLT